MILFIAIVLLLLWAGGFAINVGGDLIHLLIVGAILVFIYDQLQKRRDRI